MINCILEAYRTDIIPVNPAAKVQKPKSPKYEAKYYDIKQLKMLFDCMQGDRFELRYKMTAFYGLRRSELCGMQWNSIGWTISANLSILIHSLVTSNHSLRNTVYRRYVFTN